MVETFWTKSEIVGGGGMIGPRWPTMLRPGDRLRTRATVAQALSITVEVIREA